jgi:hypothetical protein
MDVLAETYPRVAPQEDDHASQIDVELKVAELYEEVINFTRLAIKYYQRSGFGMSPAHEFRPLSGTKRLIQSSVRALSAIYDPPKLTIQKRVDSIKEKGVKIYSAAGTLLHKRVADIYALSEAQKITIERLERKMQEGFFNNVGRQQDSKH